LEWAPQMYQGSVPRLYRHMADGRRHAVGVTTGSTPRAHQPTSGRTSGVAAKPGSSKPGILLDRDGTIIVDHGYVGSIDRVDLIEGAAEAIGRFNRAGIPVAVVSNQAGVARGFFTIDDVVRVNNFLAEQLEAYGAHVDCFIFCPYHPDGIVLPFARSSEDRKPRPGMALAAAKALGLDLRSSIVIGDRREDMGLAEQIGASGIFVGAEPPPPGVQGFPSLAGAASFVLEQLAA
jgi:histidinol-phosphate phosphatase family protein